MLGQLYVKVAGEQPSPWEQLTGVEAPLDTGGFTQPTGVATRMQMGAAFAGELFGEDEAALASSVLQFLTPYMPENTRKFLTQYVRTRSGVGTTAEAQAIAQVMAGANRGLAIGHADRFGELVRGLQGAVPEGAPDWIGGLVQQLGKTVESNPEAAGKIIQMLRQAPIPGFTPLLNQVMRDMPMSYGPLVQASYTERGGFDPQHIQSLTNEFNQMRSAGVFTGVDGAMDAADALSVYTASARMFGRNSDARTRASLAAAADTLRAYKIAPSGPAAMVMLEELGARGVLEDPLKFQEKIKGMSQRLQSIGESNAPTLMRGILEKAMKGGGTIDQEFDRIVSQRSADLAWLQAGVSSADRKRLAAGAGALEQMHTEGIQGAKSWQDLTAWVAETPEGRKAYTKLISDPNPSPDLVASMFTAARFSPTSAHSSDYNPSMFFNSLTPTQKTLFTVGEHRAYAADMAGNDPVYRDVMNNPEKYEAVFTSPDKVSPDFWKGLTPAGRRSLSNPGVQAMMQSALAQRRRPVALNQDFVPEGAALPRGKFSPTGSFLPPPPKIEPVAPPKPEKPEEPPNVRTAPP